MLSDIRYSLRVFRKAPGVTAAAILALALGIGANTAIFSVVNGVLLQPMAYKDPARLVLAWETEPDLPMAPLTVPDFLDWKQQNKVFEQIEAFNLAGFNLTGRAQPLRLDGGMATPGFFRMLGVRPEMGRDFLPDENQPGKERVAILGHALWEREFGADPGILGKNIVLDGNSHSIIGVLPAGFRLPSPRPMDDIWVPFVMRGTERRSSHFFPTIARLKPGVTLEQAQTELSGIAARLAQAYPDSNTGIGARIVPLQEQVVGRVRPMLLALAGAVGFVLLIACANVAALLLALGAARRQEMAVRTAVGAGRFRLFRQWLVESTMLGLAGGAFGTGLAYFAVRAIKLAEGARIPRLAEVTIDSQVLVFTLGISLLTGLVFGIVPALRCSLVDVNSALKEGGTRGGEALGMGRRSGRTGSFLITAEVALAFMLAICSGLMVKSLMRMVGQEFGFRAENVLTTRLALPRTRYKEPAQWKQFYRELTDRLRTLPGVEEAAHSQKIPLYGGNNGVVLIEGRPAPAGALNGTLVEDSPVSPTYFRAMGIPLKRGRWFQPDDERTDAPEVAVINESMARRFWPGEDPIGKRFSWERNPPKWISVVGVVADVRQHGIEAVPLPEEYSVYEKSAQPVQVIVVRTRMEPEAFKATLLEQIRQLDKDLPATATLTMQQLVDEQSAPRRFQTAFFAVFSGLALLLASIGIYGVFSQMVARRNSEIGLRMALGARGRQIVAVVMGRAVALAAIGIVIGVAGALALSRVLSGLLFEVKSTDPATFVVVGLMLLVVATLSVLIPARRATRVDPIAALRQS